MLGIENIRGCACEDMKEKVRSNVFNLVVAGTTRRHPLDLSGQSSLLERLNLGQFLKKPFLADEKIISVASNE